ncbi:MAG: hypothetical protein ACSLE5_03930 [Porticoccaceae bacterium]
MTEATTSLHASTPQLLKATAVALAAAGAILLTTVLPAEYGLDPTGIGKALGLTALHTPATESAAVAAAPAPSASAPAIDPNASAIQQPTPYQSGEMTLTLQANEGAEIKAQMRTGEAFVFSWVSEGGPVNFDMHGEKPNDGDNFTSYWKDREKSEGHGSFTAPFDGSQGWYWKNTGRTPVTIRVKVSGYFQKLYRPG